MGYIWERDSINMEEKLETLFKIWIALLFPLIFFTIIFSLPAIILEIYYILLCLISIILLIIAVIQKDYLPETLVVLEDKLTTKYWEAILAIVGEFLVIISLLKSDGVLIEKFIITIALISLWLLYTIYKIYDIKKKILKLKKTE